MIIIGIVIESVLHGFDSNYVLPLEIILMTSIATYAVLELTIF